MESVLKPFVEYYTCNITKLRFHVWDGIAMVTARKIGNVPICLLKHIVQDYTCSVTKSHLQMFDIFATPTASEDKREYNVFTGAFMYVSKVEHFFCFEEILTTTTSMCIHRGNKNISS